VADSNPAWGRHGSTPGFVWLEWANLLVRWLHLITGIAWIGASFYVWLDNSIRPPKPGSDLAKGGRFRRAVGGARRRFLQSAKYLVAPAELPEELHWFKWEAYLDHRCGHAVHRLLLQCLGHDGGQVGGQPQRLRSRGRGHRHPGAGWIVYDLLCRRRWASAKGCWGW
jgi:uncharacterized membrane protein